MRLQLFYEAIMTYGAPAQKQMVIEECAELIQAICKLDRAKTFDETAKAITHISEEIADVEIMLEQLKIILGNEYEVVDIKEHKIKRLAERLKKEGKNK